MFRHPLLNQHLVLGGKALIVQIHGVPDEQLSFGHRHRG